MSPCENWSFCAPPIFLFSVLQQRMRSGMAEGGLTWYVTRGMLRLGDRWVQTPCSACHARPDVNSAICVTNVGHTTCDMRD
eukprot:921806-Rhodomonas_salina.1